MSMVVHSFNTSTQRLRQVGICELESSLVYTGSSGQPCLHSETLPQTSQPPAKERGEDCRETQRAHDQQFEKITAGDWRLASVIGAGEASSGSVRRGSRLSTTAVVPSASVLKTF